MKKRSRWFFLVFFVGLSLAGCQAAATPTLSPLEWLHSQPFEPAPSKGPNFIASGLPEGFEVEADDVYTYVAELADDEYHQFTEITYTHAAGDEVMVNIVAFSSAEARSDFLNEMPEYVEEDALSFEQLSHGQVVRAQFDEIDGRIWVHGPYLILVGSVTTGPWVDAFAELYLAQPPTPGRDIAEQPQVEYPVEGQPPDLSAEQPTEVDLLAWLSEQPFEPAPPGWPQVVTGGFPEGFEIGHIEDESIELPSGEVIQGTRIEYEWPLGGQVDYENRVEVVIVGCQSVAARSEFFDTMTYDMRTYEDFTWDVEQFGDTQILHYHGYDTDGRVWVSGPYLIVIFGGAGERSPWVDVFVELYLAQPPVPGIAGTLLDWLQAKPFEPAPTGQPEVITSDLPEGFEAEGPYPWTEQLPSGEPVEMVSVSYSLAAEDWLVVVFYTFGDVSQRTEFLNMLADDGYLSPEPREWGLEQFNGSEVAYYESHGGDQGMIWISGPYLVVIQSQVYDPDPWMYIFTDLYLSMYPAE